MMAKSKSNNQKEKKQQKATTLVRNSTTRTGDSVQKEKISNGVSSEQQDTKEVLLNQLDLRFRDEIASHPGGENIRRCFACGTCAAGCPVTEVDSEYNCRRIIRQILFGMREEVLSSPLIWMCLVCYRCYVRCPQKVNFTDIMRVLRYLAVKEKRFSPETFEWINELDRFSQVVRHDMVKGFFDKKKVSLEELQSRIEKVMKEAITQ
ncbi:MAG: 4Fe-4S dicluster domain-containing protein [Planctomycetota bacterium]|jgi:heterodisulfide reductase subunit C